MYRYETHLHTCLASACGVSTGKEHAREYARRGYKGIFVTDHFFGGNTSVDQTLPWEQQVRWFVSGYEDAKSEGDRIGLDVFFAWEQTFEGDDYLVYGLGPDWLMAHPEVKQWTRAQQLEQVHAYGGMVVAAHPFRERGYLTQMLIGDRFADAIEVANGGNDPISDACAYLYAQEKNMIMTAGSDNHRSHPAAPTFGVAFNTPLAGPEDYVKRILGRQQPELLVNPSRFDMPDKQRFTLKCYLLNEKEERTPFVRPWFPGDQPSV